MKRVEGSPKQKNTGQAYRTTNKGRGRNLPFTPPTTPWRNAAFSSETGVSGWVYFTPRVATFLSQEQQGQSLEARMANPLKHCGLGDSQVQGHKEKRQIIAVRPTMGNLHEGCGACPLGKTTGPTVAAGLRTPLGASAFRCSFQAMREVKVGKVELVVGGSRRKPSVQ
jgi:hypothetical protein